MGPGFSSDMPALPPEAAVASLFGGMPEWWEIEGDGDTRPRDNLLAISSTVHT